MMTGTTVSARAGALEPPATDPYELFEHGVWGTPLPQYIKWADEAGVFRVMADRDGVTVDEIARLTEVNSRGASALIGILCALRIVDRRPDGHYVMSDVAREYLDARGPFYVGPALYATLDAPFPPSLRKGHRSPRLSDVTRERLRAETNRAAPRYDFGQPEQLRVQHSAGFAPAVVAVRTGLFDGVSHLIDLCGGSGVFSIALARSRPATRITLVDLPAALPLVGEYLRQYDVHDRVTLAGHNVFNTPWPLPQADGVLIANFLHGCDDDECRVLLGEARRTLRPRGHMFIHEMLWNEDRTGPRLTALWNFVLTAGSSGRQRTASEFTTLLADSGFDAVAVVPTAGCYSLIKGVTRD
jgi:ubiquinone/menaquinone biosynthesis C-methylase UbiE